MGALRARLRQREAAVPHTKRRSLARSEARSFYLFIAPWLIGFVVFTLYPLLSSLYYSFTSYNMVSSPKWIGLDNYARMAKDQLFWQALQVTTIYTIASVVLGMVFSLLLAVLLNQNVPYLSFFRTIFYLPTIVSGVAVALLWRLLLNPRFGLLNYAIQGLTGIEGPQWFQVPAWTLPGYILTSLWGIGGSMIIYLAGLQGVPTQLYEAAELDGANALQRFRNVTLPMISPVILFTFITSLISSFNAFDMFYLNSDRRGAPSNSALVYVMYIFNHGFDAHRMGYASALAWVLFVIVLVLTLIVMRTSRSRVYYESPDS